MIVVIIITFALLFGFSYVRIFDSISRRVLFSYLAIWLVALVLSVISPYGIYKPEESTIIIMLAHVAMFVLGFSAVKYEARKLFNVYNRDFQNQMDRLIHNKVFLAIFALIFVYVVSLFIRFYQAILLVNVSGVRKEYYTGALFGETYIHINNYVLVPFNMLVLPLFCYMVLYMRNKLCLLLGIEYILFASLSGARGGLFDIIICLIFIFYCTRKTYRKSGINDLKKYLQLGLMLAAMAFLISWMTSVRSGNMDLKKESVQSGFDETIEHTLTYLAGPIVAFDNAINTNLVEQIGGYQYGQMTFAPVDELWFNICVVSNKIFHTGLYERSINRIGSFIQDGIDIGTRWEWNALYTVCLYYYLDFGLFGVIILPFFFGLFFRKIIINFYKHNPFYIYLVSSFLFIIMIDAVTKLYFYRMSQFLFILLVLYLARRKRGKRMALNYYK